MELEEKHDKYYSMHFSVVELFLPLHFAIWIFGWERIISSLTKPEND